MWRKGVKEGCALSPRLFNPCLEPLLQAMKRNQNICGACVDMGKGSVVFTSQAYADDVVFVSECEDGIRQMLSVLEHLTSSQGSRSIYRSVQKRRT
jgi:hypothetical protein